MGLMSGTSHDGVDAAIARIDGAGEGCRVELLYHGHTPYPAPLRQRIRQAFDGPTGLVCRLNFELGEFFAEAAADAVKRAGLKPSELDLIGSHGQTICHVPSGAGAPGSTLQIAEGAVIARRTGTVTVTDFRTADVAAGGQGAPLVPMADWLIFRRTGEVTALQNIGGIANVTVVTESVDEVRGFDTGPGNSLMDDTAYILTGGKLKYDEGGKIAGSGNVIPELLDFLLANPYFSQVPPKSTGREEFGRGMVEDIISRYPGARLEDMLCTLTNLTALSIRRAYEEFVLPYTTLNRLAVCGGGAKNLYLMSLLKGLFDGLPVVTTDELGVPSQAREALCFAVLANETVSGRPGNLPAVTGATKFAVLGKISL